MSWARFRLDKAHHFELQSTQMKRTLRRLTFRLTYFLHGRWLPIRAVGIALHHIARGHHVSWFRDGDLWNAHLGWVWCDECADCDGVDLAIWAWHFPRIDSALEYVCKLYGGHREHRLAEGPSGRYDDEGTPIYAPIPGAWYCGRCLADDKPCDVTDQYDRADMNDMELPGMWESADFTGGATDMEPDKPPTDSTSVDICGETFDHDEVSYGDGYYRCRRCDAEWWEGDREQTGSGMPYAASDGPDPWKLGKE